ncbi:VanR-ABDEGLN family response regulator transcription factor [Sellimonas sp.]|uniref:VanR-ABDEGLN family response regulator transcription factor n=1 Tax=Sellimonas sp. TaxID=2021466 RepID=UPI00257A91C5|nr:VanR-ABDEGLN family response regulator transcription factor [Sellimonas sp.]
MDKKILIVDDEQAIADLVELYLANEGYQILKYYNGNDALACIEKEDLSMAILDVMLPGVDGYQLLRKIREHHFYPVIMLTAKSQDTDKILGLTIGADDYITKPFNPLELVARVKTQFRRYERYNHAETMGTQPPEDHSIDIRGLSIDKDSHKCSLNGNPLSLTPREFSILWYLCQNRGRVISSEELFEHVWGEKFLDSNNTVMSHIGRIREKMNDSGRRPKYIKTVWGVGYQIE